MHSNPQEDYEMFSKLVKYAKDKYLPKRKKKYDKKRHMKSSLMTRSIYNSFTLKICTKNFHSSKTMIYIVDLSKSTALTRQN